MEEFDSFSGNYKEILDRSIRISGYDVDYFAEYKASYAANSVLPGFSGKILDFGCGVGILSAFLRKHLPASVLHGFDVSSASIEKIDATLVAQGMFTSRSDQLDYDYGLIVVSNVMHHISPTDRQKTIVELRERLAHGGRLLVFEHNPVNPLTRWVVEHCPLDRDAVLLPLKEALTYMILARLRLIRRDYIVFFPRPLAWLRSLERHMSWCPLGAQYVLVGEKNG